MADKPVTREEKYLAYLTGDYTGELPKPITRKEKYLYELCLKGIGGEISPEEIKAAVNEYLEKNPVKPGATTEQAQQIEQNKTDVASLKEETGSLKEDLGNIIYKRLINGFDKDNTVGGYLRNNGNVASDSRFVTSDYFDVDENKTYYALQMVGTVKYDTTSYICFYDSSKTFIAGGYFHASPCTSPNGSKYARVTFPSDETVKARCMFTSI